MPAPVGPFSALLLLATPVWRPADASAPVWTPASVVDVTSFGAKVRKVGPGTPFSLGVFIFSPRSWYNSVSHTSTTRRAMCDVKQLYQDLGMVVNFKWPILSPYPDHE